MQIRLDDLTGGEVIALLNEHLADMYATSPAELKSMRTARAFRGQGVGQALLQFIIDHAKAQGFSSLSLETGTQDYFAPARALYRKFGFTDCGPFGPYKLDPDSHFMTLKLC